jgi:transcriptional regulator with XRE-family HTH domain
VPRKNPVPDREIQICERLRQARHDSNLSQVTFARMIGIDSSRLASYEHGRVPVRFDLALKVATLTGVSLRWLAEGVEPVKFRFVVSENLLMEIPKNYLFSVAWDHLLKPSFDGEIKKFESRAKIKISSLDARHSDMNIGGMGVGHISGEEILRFLMEDLIGVLESIPPHLVDAFYAEITNAWRHFMNVNTIEIHAWESRKKNFPENKLTVVSFKGNNAGVHTKSPIPKTVEELIERVNRIAESPGLKADLANFCKVTPARVWEWLNGKKAPGGKYTLKLIHWANEHESKK